MKIKFANFLREYRKVPLGMTFDKMHLINFLADEDNLSLLRTHISANNRDFVIYEYSFGPKDLLFVLSDRLDKEDVAGYLFIKKIGEYWQVQDVSIYPAYRGLGLGVDIYVKVIDTHYTLLSGFSLSNEAEKLWREKLPKFVNVKVFDKTENKILPFSDLPKDDVKSDVEQRYFYVASSTKELPEGLNENAGIDVDLDVRYERWLRVDKTYKFHGFRSSKYGEMGDF